MAAARSYRLLRAVVNTAVDEDRILPRNPCRVPGATATRSWWVPIRRSHETQLMSSNNKGPDGRKEPLTCAFVVERMTGIEPAFSAWEPDCPSRSRRWPAGAWAQQC